MNIGIDARRLKQSDLTGIGMYVKYIRQHPGLDRIKPSHTPTELERAVTARGDARIRELYERARYAPELTTDEDVREMKQEIRAVTG